LMKTHNKYPCSKSDLYWIFWNDASGERLTEQEVKRSRLLVNTNLGWIIDEDKKRIVLAYGVSESGERDVFKIPAGWIIKRVRVTRTKG